MNFKMRLDPVKGITTITQAAAMFLETHMPAPAPVAAEQPATAPGSTVVSCLAGIFRCSLTCPSPVLLQWCRDGPGNDNGSMLSLPVDTGDSLDAQHVSSPGTRGGGCAGLLPRLLTMLQVLLQGMPQVDSDWSLVGGGSDDGAEPEIPSEATRTRHAAACCC